MIPKSKIVQRLFELSDTILESMRIDLKILEQWSEKPGKEAWFRRGACFRLKINVGLLEELYLMMEYILLWIRGTTRDIENVSRLKCNRVLFFFFFYSMEFKLWKNLGWNIFYHVGKFNNWNEEFGNLKYSFTYWIDKIEVKNLVGTIEIPFYWIDRI